MKNSLCFPLGALVVLMIVGLFVAHTRSPDGIQGPLLEILLRGDTEYAKGYTDEAFASVRIGQTSNAVVDALGEPLWKSRGFGRGKERWMYSRSPSSTHYRYREVQFVDGLVREKISQFYFD